MKWNLAQRNHRESNPGLLFRKNIEDVFDDFFSFKPTTLFQSGWMPKMDVEQQDNVIKIKAEMPGLSEKDINVTLADNVLTISGEKKNEKEEKKDGKSIISERFFGSFSREIRLPKGVKDDEIKADFKNGVLSIDVPLSEAKMPKKITIQ